MYCSVQSPKHLILTDFYFWHLFPLNRWNDMQMFTSDRFLKAQTVSLIAYILFCSLTPNFFKKWAPLKYTNNFTLTFSLFPDIRNNGIRIHNYELKQSLYASKLIFTNLDLLHRLSRPFVSVGAISVFRGTLCCYTVFITDTTQTFHKIGEVNK